MATQQTPAAHQNIDLFSRCIYVDSALNNQGVFIEICGGMLDKETVQLQFRNATGLKYIEGVDRVAVHSTGTNFAIPENVEGLVVIELLMLLEMYL